MSKAYKVAKNVDYLYRTRIVLNFVLINQLYAKNHYLQLRGTSIRHIFKSPKISLKLSLQIKQNIHIYLIIHHHRLLELFSIIIGFYIIESSLYRFYFSILYSLSLFPIFYPYLHFYFHFSLLYYIYIYTLYITLILHIYIFMYTSI